MSETHTYSVPGVSCEHCVRAITDEVAPLDGVATVAVDLGSRRVTVTGENLHDADLRAAIEEAGYDIAS